MLWKKLCLKIFEEDLLSFLRLFVHRNTKAGVSSELIIPEQTNHTYSLSLSKVEKHYYDTLLVELQADLKTQSNDKENKIAMAAWIVRLRQTWCVFL